MPLACLIPTSPRSLARSLARLAAGTALASAIALAPLAIGAQDAEPERPKIFKWIDENGIAHYTTDRSRVPSGLRERAERLGSPTPALEREAREPRAPADGFDSYVARDRRTESTDIWDQGGDGVVTTPLGAPVAPQRSPEEVAQQSAERDALDAEISALEVAVAADEDLLKSFISDPNTSPLDRGDDDEFRAVARRLPQSLGELRTLRDRRDALATQ